MNKMLLIDNKWYGLVQVGTFLDGMGFQATMSAKIRFII